MANKTDYLKDLREHSKSTGGETAARLDVSEAGVLEGFRRARRQNLVSGDGGRPEKFTLTESGLRELRLTEHAPSPNPALLPSSEEKPRDLEARLNDTEKNIRGLFQLVDEVLSAKPESARRGTDSLSDELHERVETLEGEQKKRSLVLEFYSVRLARAPFKGKPEILEARQNALASQLDSDAQQEINRLVALEADLAEENGKLFGPAADVARQLVAEIGRLRQKYGFPSMDLGETAESEEAAENAEEGPDAELLR